MSDDLQKLFSGVFYSTDTKWYNLDLLEKSLFRYVIFIDPHNAEGLPEDERFGRINYKNGSVKSLYLNFGHGDYPPNILSQIRQAIDFMKKASSKCENFLILDRNGHKQKAFTIVMGYLMASGESFEKVYYNNQRALGFTLTEITDYYKSALLKYESLHQIRKRRTVQITDEHVYGDCYLI